LKNNISINDRYVTDIKILDQAPNLPTGAAPVGGVRWIQYKIPVAEAENAIGGISDLRTVNFMRMFLTGFSEQITIRFGALDLVRGEWRRYLNTLDNTDSNVQDDDTVFEVQAVNIQENGDRIPI